MQARPILLNSCTRAATAAEARFRVDYPLAPARGTCVVALDAPAAAVARRAAELPWHEARFFLATAAEPAVDVVLTGLDGVTTWLGEILPGADVVVMVATSDTGAPLAATIGDACTLRGIMTAGLVLPDQAGQAAGAVATLRPHARVLLQTQDEQDVVEVLTALRA